MNTPSGNLESNKPGAFHSAEHPAVVAELADLKSRLQNLQQPGDDLVIISYAKTHSIPEDLAKSHPALVKILTSKGSCVHLENIFSTCSGNALFRNSLENYIKYEINFHGGDTENVNQPRLDTFDTD